MASLNEYGVYTGTDQEAMDAFESFKQEDVLRTTQKKVAQMEGEKAAYAKANNKPYVPERYVGDIVKDTAISVALKAPLETAQAVTGILDYISRKIPLSSEEEAEIRQAESDPARAAELIKRAQNTNGFSEGLKSIGIDLEASLDWAEGQQSEQLQAGRDSIDVARARRGQVLAAEAAEREASGVEESAMDIAMREARGVYDALSDYGGNLDVLADDIAVELGGIVTTGGVGRWVAKGTSAAVNAGVKKAGKKGLSEAAREKITKFTGEVVGVGGAVIEEAGLAAEGIRNKVNSLKDADLIAGSDYYAELRNEGVSEADAKELLGSAAANDSLVGNAISAGLLSILTRAGSIEGNLFNEGILRNTARNVLSETVEEGAQGAAGQLIENKVTQDLIDREQALTENIGYMPLMVVH